MDDGDASRPLDLNMVGAADSGDAELAGESPERAKICEESVSMVITVESAQESGVIDGVDAVIAEEGSGGSAEPATVEAAAAGNCRGGEDSEEFSMPTLDGSPRDLLVRPGVAEAAVVARSLEKPVEAVEVGGATAEEEEAGDISGGFGSRNVDGSAGLEELGVVKGEAGCFVEPTSVDYPGEDDDVSADKISLNDALASAEAACPNLVSGDGISSRERLERGDGFFDVDQKFNSGLAGESDARMRESSATDFEEAGDIFGDCGSMDVDGSARHEVLGIVKGEPGCFVEATNVDYPNEDDGGSADKNSLNDALESAAATCPDLGTGDDFLGCEGLESGDGFLNDDRKCDSGLAGESDAIMRVLNVVDGDGFQLQADGVAGMKNPGNDCEMGQNDGSCELTNQVANRNSDITVDVGHSELPADGIGGVSNSRNVDGIDSELQADDITGVMSSGNIGEVGDNDDLCEMKNQMVNMNPDTTVDGGNSLLQSDVIAGVMCSGNVGKIGENADSCEVKNQVVDRDSDITVNALGFELTELDDGLTNRARAISDSAAEVVGTDDLKDVAILRSSQSDDGETSEIKNPGTLEREVLMEITDANPTSSGGIQDEPSDAVSRGPEMVDVVLGFSLAVLDDVVVTVSTEDASVEAADTQIACRDDDREIADESKESNELNGTFPDRPLDAIVGNVSSEDTNCCSQIEFSKDERVGSHSLHSVDSEKYIKPEPAVAENNMNYSVQDDQTRCVEAIDIDRAIKEQDISSLETAKVSDSAANEKKPIPIEVEQSLAEAHSSVLQVPDSRLCLPVVTSQVIDVISDNNNPATNIDVVTITVESCSLVENSETWEATENLAGKMDVVQDTVLVGETHFSAGRDQIQVKESKTHLIGTCAVDTVSFVHEGDNMTALSLIFYDDQKGTLPVDLFNVNEQMNTVVDAEADADADKDAQAEKETVLIEPDLQNDMDNEGKIIENKCVNVEKDALGVEKESSKEADQTTPEHSITSHIEGTQQVTYSLLPQERAGFSICDLVWGKVKSHPWWPGQIFGSSDASDLALKYQKKDGFLVAYFADKTFAWCVDSQLKPFQCHFSQLIKQGTTSDTFLKAVNDALGELSRRTLLAMMCSCLVEESYADAKNQNLENAGIRRGISSCVFDRLEIVNAFQPEKLVEFIRALAMGPSGETDGLGLVIAQAQLKAFYSSKGYPGDRVYFVGGLVDADVEVSPSTSEMPLKHTTEESSPRISELLVASRGRKKKIHPPVEEAEESKKRKSISEPMEEETISQLVDVVVTESPLEVSGKSSLHRSGKKVKTHDISFSLESNDEMVSPFEDSAIRSASSSISSSHRSSKKKTLDAPLTLESNDELDDPFEDLTIKSPSSTRIGSFKIGDCIRRAASQLTGAKPVLRNCEPFQKNEYNMDDTNIDISPHAPLDSCGMNSSISSDLSPCEMLSELLLSAQDPLKGDDSANAIIWFFSEFRDSFASTPQETEHVEATAVKRGRKKGKNPKHVSSDTLEPDHMSDLFWSDMLAHNNTEESPAGGTKRRGPDMRSPRRKRKYTREPAPQPPSGTHSDSEKLHIKATNSGTLQELVAKRPIISSRGKRADDSLPTELVLFFNKSDSIPSETDLIRIFSRYGPLREAETEVLRKVKHAKVVFRKRADAETAFSSAGKYSIFGPALISYRLRYLSSPSSAPPDVNTQDTEAEANDPVIEAGNAGVPLQANDPVIEAGNAGVPLQPNDQVQEAEANDPVREAGNAGVPLQPNDQVQEAMPHSTEVDACLDVNNVDAPCQHNDSASDAPSLLNDTHDTVSYNVEALPDVPDETESGSTSKMDQDELRATKDKEGCHVK